MHKILICHGYINRTFTVALTFAIKCVFLELSLLLILIYAENLGQSRRKVQTKVIFSDFDLHNLPE